MEVIVTPSGVFLISLGSVGEGRIVLVKVVFVWFIKIERDFVFSLKERTLALRAEELENCGGIVWRRYNDL